MSFGALKVIKRIVDDLWKYFNQGFLHWSNIADIFLFWQLSAVALLNGRSELLHYSFKG